MIKIITVLIIFCYSMVGYAAQQDADSSNQIMQQLQILRQKMEKAQKKISSVEQGDAANATPQKQSNNKSNRKSTSAARSRIPSPNVSSPSNIPQSSQGSLFESADPAIEEAAFRNVAKSNFPLSPEQILRLHQMYNSIQFARQASPGTPPRPTITSQFVKLDPGSTPPVVRLQKGFVSSLVFLDSSGAPWPIASYDLGDPSAFNIQWDKSGNTLMIQANKLYTYGNLAIRLIGLNTPLMMNLIPGQKAVDYRVDLRVQGYGPNAKALPTGVNLPPTSDPILLSVLDGVPPPSSKTLSVIGGQAQAWSRGDKLFVRTRLTIISPGWISTLSSADGMKVYEMMRTPVLLVSWHGKVMQLKLEGF